MKNKKNIKKMIWHCDESYLYRSLCDVEVDARLSCNHGQDCNKAIVSTDQVLL